MAGYYIRQEILHAAIIFCFTPIIGLIFLTLNVRGLEGLVYLWSIPFLQLWNCFNNYNWIIILTAVLQPLLFIVGYMLFKKLKNSKCKEAL
jgi:hypothetical protein